MVYAYCRLNNAKKVKISNDHPMTVDHNLIQIWALSGLKNNTFLKFSSCILFRQNRPILTPKCKIEMTYSKIEV